jgi:hypothetical protein
LLGAWLSGHGGRWYVTTETMSVMDIIRRDWIGLIASFVTGSALIASLVLIIDNRYAWDAVRSDTRRLSEQVETNRTELLENRKLIDELRIRITTWTNQEPSVPSSPRS